MKEHCKEFASTALFVMAVWFSLVLLAVGTIGMVRILLNVL